MRLWGVVRVSEARAFLQLWLLSAYLAAVRHERDGLPLCREIQARNAARKGGKSRHRAASDAAC